MLKNTTLLLLIIILACTNCTHLQNNNRTFIDAKSLAVQYWNEVENSTIFSNQFSNSEPKLTPISETITNVHYYKQIKSPFQRVTFEVFKHWDHVGHLSGVIIAVTDQGVSVFGRYPIDTLCSNLNSLAQFEEDVNEKVIFDLIPVLIKLRYPFDPGYKLIKSKLLINSIQSFESIDLGGLTLHKPIVKTIEDTIIGEYFILANGLLIKEKLKFNSTGFSIKQDRLGRYKQAKISL